jgi:hypothetical protein
VDFPEWAEPACDMVVTLATFHFEMSELHVALL